MKKILCCILLLAVLISAQVPKFANSGFIKANNTPISLLLSCPWAGDWNGDGKKDLIFGMYSGGKLSLYLNSGTNNAPLFTTSSFLKAGSVDISLSAGWCIGASNPQVEDLNGDGYKDLIVGERDGYVNFFSRNSDGTLKAKVRIQANKADIKVSTNSSPEVVDWNEDGFLDLLVGSDVSTDGIRLYLNSGTKTEYQFTSFTKIKANNIDIALQRCQIQVVDLNSDGKKDLVAGNGLTENSSIYFYENSGTNASPVLKAGVALKKTDNTPINSRYDVHFCFTDWNEDGVFDLIYTEYTPFDTAHLYLGQKQSDISHTPGINLTTVYKNVSVTHKKYVVPINLKNDQEVLLKLYNNSGRLIELKYTGQLNAGEHTVELNLANHHAGIYLLRYTVNYQEMKQKIILMK